MDRDAYAVRLGRPAEAPAPEAEMVVAPHEPRRSVDTGRWIKRGVILVVVVAVAMNMGTIRGWLGLAAEKVEAPVRAFQADRDLRHAGEAFADRWADHRSYNVDVDTLATAAPDVRWGDVVTYRVCFVGQGVVFTAMTATGERSVLHVRGTEYRPVAGEHGCPASPDRIAPWSEL